MPWPQTVGECVDLAFAMRAERLAAQKQVDEVKAQEELLKDHVLHLLADSNIDGAKGRVATAAVQRRVVAQVSNWDEVYQYIQDNAAFDLLQKRVNDTAFRERIESGEAIPGVEPFTVVTLSLTKAGK